MKRLQKEYRQCTDSDTNNEYGYQSHREAYGHTFLPSFSINDPQQEAESLHLDFTTKLHRRVALASRSDSLAQAQGIRATLS